MASVNKVILLGNLGRDPETRYTPGGEAVTTFSMATTEQWNDKEGVKQERTEWHRVTAWRRLGEIAAEYLVKGSPVYIEGRIQYREFTDKEGVKKWSTDIVADKLQLLGKKPDSQQQRTESSSSREPSKTQEVLDEDIPF